MSKKRVATDALPLNEQVGNALLPLVQQHLQALGAYQPGFRSTLPLKVTRTIVDAWEKNAKLKELYEYVRDPNRALWLKREIGDVRVAIWDEVRGVKLSGKNAPRAEDLEAFLVANPRCRVYAGEEAAAPAKKPKALPASRSIHQPSASGSEIAPPVTRSRSSELPIGSKALYEDADGVSKDCEILKIHYDDPPPYYTIKIGVHTTRERLVFVERQTQRSRLKQFRSLLTREDFMRAAEKRDLIQLRVALHAAAAKGKKAQVKMIRSAVDEVDAKTRNLNGEASRLAPGEVAEDSRDSRSPDSGRVHADGQGPTLFDFLLRMRNLNGQTAQEVAQANGNHSLAKDHLSSEGLLDARGYTENFMCEDERNGDANHTFHW